MTAVVVGVTSYSLFAVILIQLDLARCVFIAAIYTRFHAFGRRRID